jgi:hypothetical protein
MLGKDMHQADKKGTTRYTKLLEDSLFNSIIGLAYPTRMVPATHVGLYLHDWAGLGYKNGPRNTGIHVNVGHCPAHMNSSLINK